MKGLILMLTKKEVALIDEYIKEILSPKEKEFEEVDDFIFVCSLDINTLVEFERLANFYIKKLTETINNEFLKYKGVTLSMIAAQERLCQLKILFNKLDGRDSIHETAMLCIASSMDLYHLESQKNNYIKAS
jgi:hypothetical protein